VAVGATLDRAFRAFDVETGKELWKASLPAGARATPMTYEAGGRQFVVIAAGRCPFTAEGLLAVADLVDRLRSGPGRGTAVKQIMP